VGGVATGEQVWLDGAPERADERPLLTPAVRSGRVVGGADVASAREHCRRALAELPAEAMKLSAGEPAIETRWEKAPR
jgi:nicotinate phosphoribosyltransferase